MNKADYLASKDVMPFLNWLSTRLDVSLINISTEKQGLFGHVTPCMMRMKSTNGHLVSMIYMAQSRKDLALQRILFNLAIFVTAYSLLIHRQTSLIWQKPPEWSLNGAV